MTVTPPRFDHREPGTPASDWAAVRATLPAGALVGEHDRLVVLAAHPDDETLGAGGLIARAARAGAAVTVVVASDGEASHPASPTHTPAELAAARQQEVATAVGTLAPDADLVLLHRPDGTLDAAGLGDVLAEYAADASVIAAPWRHDGHPDHEACGRAAAELARQSHARLLEYPIWAWHWGRPGVIGPLAAPGWVTSSLPPEVRAAKVDALAAHRSQHAPLSSRRGDEPLLSAELLAHFTGDAEVFCESAPVDLPARYFDRLYAASDDPWRLDSGFYEHRKRQLLLAALPRARFARGLEAGCASGATTVELARRCDELLAVDVADAAVAAARERTADLPGVEVQRRTLPAEWPGGLFDLIVVSELGYYLADPAGLATRVRASLNADGIVVACHWRHPAPGYPSGAADVHHALGVGLHRLVRHVEADFLLDVWGARASSVAQREGVLP